MYSMYVTSVRTLATSYTLQGSKLKNPQVARCKFLVPSLNNVNNTGHTMAPLIRFDRLTFVGTFFHDESKAR